jgi:Trk-type K+ transport system membrane component
MASGVSGRIWAGRELVDRLARQSPARLAITVFAAVIAVFTGLLSTPFATTSGVRAPFVDAFFTATSAVCVTGLVTVPTGTYWSPFGQAVILVAIKVGGLGVMTLASLLGMAVSRRIGLTQKLLTASETKTTRLGEVGSLIRVVIITSTTIEVMLALLLVPRFLVLRETTGEALWHGIFYAVSVFNNAGFIPTEEGLAPHAGDWLLLVPIIVGAFIGALGFPVILNVARNRRQFRRWSLHAKLTVVTSALLVVFGAVMFIALEWTNAGTFGSMSVGDKLLSGVFMSVMPRSAGFSTVDIGQMHEASWLITDALMFVGGGSASTAGGIKVTTLAVLALAVFSEAKGRQSVEAFGRRIPSDVQRVALSVVAWGATIVALSTITIGQITQAPIEEVLFDVISGFATVGLSTGLTAELPDPAVYVLALTMFMGRIGTVTLAAAVAASSRSQLYSRPVERPIVG